MNPKKIQAAFMNIGASSLLVIFLILCLSIFATLSLSGSKNDYSYSEKMAEHKTAYYDASNQSEWILDQVDALLAKAAADSKKEQEFYETAVENISRDLSEVSIAYADSSDVPVLSWQIPIDDSQMLWVELTLKWPHTYDDKKENGGFYQIERWQTAASE